MRWLRRAGRRGTSVRQLLDAHRRGAAQGLVGLSFDDGYADFIDYALPVLQRFGFGATMFMPAGLARRRQCLGSRGTAQAAALGRPACVRWRRPGSRSARMAFATCSSSQFRSGSLAQRKSSERDILPKVTGQAVDWLLLPVRSPRRAQFIDGVGQGPATPTGCAVWETGFAGRYALPREYIRDADSPGSLWARGARRWLRQELSRTGLPCRPRCQPGRGAYRALRARSGRGIVPGGASYRDVGETPRSGQRSVNGRGKRRCQ